MLGIGMVIEDIHLCLTDFEFCDVAKLPDQTGCGNCRATLTNGAMFPFCSHGVKTPRTGHSLRPAPSRTPLRAAGDPWRCHGQRRPYLAPLPRLPPCGGRPP